MTNNEQSLTFHLFARPSFLEGLCRILDLYSSLQVYNRDRTGVEADTRALYNDWQMVGRDIESSIECYEQET